LLARAGLLLRRSSPARPWIGPIALNFSDGSPRITNPVLEDTPAYAAGLDRGDELQSFDGTSLTTPGRLDELVQRRKPGEQVRLAIRRRGRARELTIVIEEDPRLHVVPAETTGRQLTAAERVFRDAWLGSKQ
jgi:predicted metalloprotease with PDZ domain